MLLCKHCSNVIYSSTQPTLNTTLNRASKIHALPHRDWSLDISESLSGVVLHQAGDEGALSTLGKATTASSMGGVRSTMGKWSFLVCTSRVHLTDRAARTVDFKVVVIAYTELHA